MQFSLTLTSSLSIPLSIVGVKFSCYVMSDYKKKKKKKKKCLAVGIKLSIKLSWQRCLRKQMCRILLFCDYLYKSCIFLHKFYWGTIKQDEQFCFFLGKLYFV